MGSVLNKVVVQKTGFPFASDAIFENGNLKITLPADSKIFPKMGFGAKQLDDRWFGSLTIKYCSGRHTVHLKVEWRFQPDPTLLSYPQKGVTIHLSVDGEPWEGEEC